MKYCGDTWFLLHLFEKDANAVALIEDTKRGKARFVIPMVAYAEAIKKLMQRGAPRDIIEQFFMAVEASEKVELTPVDKSVAEEAARVSLTFSVPLIDSMVAATARLTGCDVLLSGDSDYSLLAKRKYLKVQSW